MAAIHRNDIREPIVRLYTGVFVDSFILMKDNACPIQLGRL